MSNLETDPQRLTDATRLVEDFNLREDAEFFSDPAKRIELLESLSADEFFSIVQHVNARVRGYEPRDNVNAKDEGAYLMLLGTPRAEEKPEAFRAGYNTIKDYLRTSNDSPEQKVRGVAMATEALVIWVHPFNDGNGRTSRFMGKFIEDGSTNTDQLIAETADKNSRMRMYMGNLRIDKANIFKDLDVILDDDEEEALKATEMPVADGISLSINRLLHDISMQNGIEAEAMQYKERREQALARIADKQALAS